VAALALAATLGGAVVAGCGAGPAGQPGAGATASTSPVSATRAASASSSAGTPTAGTPTAGTPAASTPAAATSPAAPAKPSALPVSSPGAARLPQTSTEPSTDDAAFSRAVHDIWLAVSTGNAGYALPAFFPEQAYQQVKAIADPSGDWHGRLWLDFTLDLAAAHKLVEPGATLAKVVVPAQYAQWIPPGACYNSMGYWHLPGARVVYREGGVTHSFGIASLISWRGDWYLIHLGALTRGGAYGIVDDPEAGPGVPGPPGGC
jgi:hypothetical protein